MQPAVQEAASIAAERAVVQQVTQSSAPAPTDVPSAAHQSLSGRNSAYQIASQRRNRNDGIASLKTVEHRLIGKANIPAMKPKVYDAGYVGRMEMDTHADTFCAGKNFTVMH
jgi:hypothetical protein